MDSLGPANIKNDPTGDPLLAVVAGILAYEIAAERVDAKGPGSFLAGFLDAIYQLREEVQKDRFSFPHWARVVAADV